MKTPQLCCPTAGRWAAGENMHLRRRCALTLGRMHPESEVCMTSLPRTLCLGGRLRTTRRRGRAARSDGCGRATGGPHSSFVARAALGWAFRPAAIMHLMCLKIHPDWGKPALGQRICGFRIGTPCSLALASRGYSSVSRQPKPGFSSSSQRSAC
jgi:hypothetical protein